MATNVIKQAETEIFGYNQRLEAAFDKLRKVITRSQPGIRNGILERTNRFEKAIAQEQEAAIREKYGLRLGPKGKLSVIKP